MPVIHDGTKVIKDSWAIAEHLEANYAGRPLFPNDPTHSYARFVNGWTDLSINAALFPLICADLVERVRPEDKAYIVETRSKRIGTTDFAGFQAKAREKGIQALRAALEPARRVLAVQKFLSGDSPAYPDYILFGTFMWARIVSPLELLDEDDVVHAWRERMLDLFDGMGRKAKGP